MYVGADLLPPMVLPYDEPGHSHDSPEEKATGSLLNAAAAVLLILFVTFFLLLLYRCGASKFIYGWLAMSVLVLLGGTGGLLLLCVLCGSPVEQLGLPVDYLSFYLFLWSFSVCGLVSVAGGAPDLLRQGYLVAISVIMAWLLTNRLAEWTCWGVLLGLAAYDLCSVLTPYGPLRMLIETADQREEPIPGLVYETLVPPPPSQPRVDSSGRRAGGEAGLPVSLNTPLVDPAAAAVTTAVATNGTPQRRVRSLRERPVPVSDADAPLSIKLGLGDFVFYSVALGQALQKSVIAGVMVLWALLFGLVSTLLLLAVGKSALPALPISIATAFIVFVVANVAVIPVLASSDA